MIGNFDGIHLGHQMIFQSAKKLAVDHQLETAVLSFEPHPLKVLAPEKAPPLLQTPKQKEALLVHYGIDHFLRLPFDLAFSRLSPHAFLEQLRAMIDFRVLFVGFNFRFGRERSGDVRTLRDLAPEFGFKPVIVPPRLDEQGHVISSSRVRGLVARGDMAAAATLLGRPYFLEGQVRKGARLGRKLEAPTANLLVANEQKPRFGVYASWTRVEGRFFRSITNVGKAPTIERGEVRVETHLFDFEGSLYDKHVFVSFGTFLRPERKFDSLETLSVQIREDIRARLELADHEPPTFLLAPT